MHKAKHGIALLDCSDDDADGDEVIHLLEGDALFLHFSVDAVKVLRTAVQGGFDAVFLQLFADSLHALRHVGRALDLHAFDLFAKVSVFLRIQVHESEVFKLALHLAHA
ncbi:hypothetical protein SDC9_208361 [bioreactor metagenome]|uniref:Uncharacterized protein n=1 Tax=bioreactor metagenome TaxID=1076179 RepID=A0A645JBV4_9ZZZZ